MHQLSVNQEYEHVVNLDHDPSFWLQAAEVVPMLHPQQILQERYQLVEQLGQTVGRQTWLATDLATPQAPSVVVKLLAFSDQVNWDALTLFEREAKILRQLDHPQIPKYCDFFTIDDRILWFALVQAFIPGASFKDLLTQRQRFSERWICQIAADVLQILLYLHSLNPPVFHRDIKPSNLIWGNDKRVHLIDFGAVQDKAAVEGATFTVVGTYGYTPIEQFGGRTVPSSDLYALGATLIHLLTGVSPADLPQRNLRVQFANKTSVHLELVHWIEKLTEPDVTQRFSSARAALGTLRSVVQTFRSSPIPFHGTIRPTPSVQTDAIVYPRPSSSNIELSASPETLVIRSPHSRSSSWCIASGSALLLAGVLTLPFIFISTLLFPLLFLGSILLIGGLSTCTASVLVFTRNSVFEYKEMVVFSCHNRGELNEAAISSIQDVIHYGSEQGATRGWVVSIQTHDRDYVFKGVELTRAECKWLVQEIKRWLSMN